MNVSRPFIYSSILLNLFDNAILSPLLPLTLVHLLKSQFLPCLASNLLDSLLQRHSLLLVFDFLKELLLQRSTELLRRILELLH
jgi:hypothetical protein